MSQFPRVQHPPCPICSSLETVFAERTDSLYDQFNCPGCGHRWLVPRDGASPSTVVVTPKPSVD